MASTNPSLEVACFDLPSIVAADRGDADRIEICVDRSSGGLTPSLRLLHDARLSSRKPLFAMIRPRGGGFDYTEAEFKQMKDTIRIINEQKVADGFVFGILDATGQVDVARNSRLVELSGPLPCTFHRAFDETVDLEKALEDVICCGFKTILTSGGATNAMTGADMVKNLIYKATERVMVMPGGGVRSSNAQRLMLKTNALWYHSSAILDGGDKADVDEVQKIRRAINPSSGDARENE